MVALGLSAAAGCSEDQQVRFADLKDGDFVGGLATIAIETDPSLRAVAAELFVDGQLATAEVVAPFDLRLDATRFEEKKHQLTLRVTVDGGDVFEDSVRVTFDNTPPVIGDLPAMMNADASVALTVHDNFGIARYEVESSLSPGNVSSSLNGANVIWPAGCGPARVKVRAIDLAGNVAERSFDVVNADAKDFDCDGFRRAPQGEDCDDLRKWIHPGAPEIVEGFDFNCDGQVERRDGSDFDGDGVLSIADGGDDCDDADATVHGAAMRHRQLPLLRGGAPITWQPDEAVAMFEALYLSRGGVIERVAPVAGADSAITQLATGANPRSFDVSGATVAFGRGTEIVLVDATTGELQSSFDTGNTVGMLSYVHSFTSATTEVENVTYQSGGKIWVATRPINTAGPWNQRVLATVAAPLIARPRGFVHTEGAQVDLRTAERTWHVSIDKDGKVSESSPGVRPADITAVLDFNSGYIQTIVGVDTAGGGHVLQSWSGSLLFGELAFPARITAIHAHGNDFVVQLADHRAFIVRQLPRLRVAQTLPSFQGPFNGAAGAALATAGWFYRPDQAIYPAFGSETTKDFNCDGFRSAL